MRENIMLSTSTSNSSFLNGNNFDGNYDVDDRLTLTLDCDTRENYREPMSKIRKIAFIASISSCILVVIVFLLLPCSKNCVAKHGTQFTKTINWIKNYERLELKGSINTVGMAKENSPLNLIFMYRNDKIFPDLSVRKGKQKSNGGIMRINGNTGEIAWQNEMTNEPKYADCSLIDCDNNGIKDCLVLDSFFQLACIDGQSGHWIYYNSNAKATKQRNRDLLDFPLILPDLNSDGVNEIMMGSSNGKSNSTNLILLSGSNGKTLAEEKLNCSYVHKLQIDSDYVLKFICVVKENTEQQVFKNLSDYYSLMTKKPNKKLQPVSSISQHKYFGRRASINAHTVITNIQDKELVIENKEMWPRSKTTLKITGNRNGEIINYYKFAGSKIYAFTPVTFSLNVTITKSRVDNIHGFVVKFWIWNGTEISYNLEKNRPKRDLKAQRSNYTNQNQTFATYKTKVRFLKESILLIVFNSTNMKAENVSQSNIVQFCQRTIGERSSDTEDAICQPDLSYQENSILITDIDKDGSKELVSYYSTFYDENQGENVVTDRWKLKTTVQLFKLETELPKLYGSDYDIF